MQTVHNAIDLSEFKFIEKPNSPEPYLAWMGRMVPEKGKKMTNFELIMWIDKKLGS